MSTNHEILNIFDVNQLQPHKTQYACGYFATALCFAASELDKPLRHDAAWVIQSAFAWYAEDNGTYDISNSNGMKSIDNLYNLIVRKGGHYQAIQPTPERIKGWLEDGYPVIVTVAESTVYDVGLQGNPYTWDSNGWNHIIVATGVDAGHIFYCRDTVNQRDGSPYRYDFDKMTLIYATIFVPDWKPRPTNDIPPAQQTGDDSVSIDIHNPNVAFFFEELNPHQWQRKGTTKTIGYGMLNYYKNNGLKPLCGLSWPRLPLTNERAIETFGPEFEHLKGHGITIQVFEAGALVYDAQHVLDDPQEAGEVYPLKTYDPSMPTVDPLIVQLQAEIATLQKQQAVPPTIVKDMQQIKAIAAKY